MSRVPFALAALLLASVALANRLETEFSIPLPCKQALLVQQGGAIYGDVFYAICGTYGRQVVAVNLTARTTIWVSNLTRYFAFRIAATRDTVLVSSNYYTVALSAQTGQLLWEGEEYMLWATPEFAPMVYAYRDTLYAFIVNRSGEEARTGFQAIDAATGSRGAFQLGNNPKLDGTTAFITLYSVGKGGWIVNQTLSAIDIPTNRTLWTVRTTPQGMPPLVSSQYVAFENVSDGECGVVLHRENGTVAYVFQGFEGWARNPRASIDDNALFALVGYGDPRYVVANLTTGYITWTRSAADVGSKRAVFSGNAVVSINEALVLSITPVSGNSPSINIPHVPSLPLPTIVDFGSGLVMVGNKQGYTFWDTTTGTLLHANEQAPDAGLIPPLKWDGLGIMLSGDVVIGVKVVQ